MLIDTYMVISSLLVVFRCSGFPAHHCRLPAQLLRARGNLWMDGYIHLYSRAPKQCHALAGAEVRCSHEVVLRTEMALKLLLIDSRQHCRTPWVLPRKVGIAVSKAPGSNMEAMLFTAMHFFSTPK